MGLVMQHLRIFWPSSGRGAGGDLQFDFSGLSGDFWLDSGEVSGWSTPGPSHSCPLETPLCVKSALLEGEPSLAGSTVVQRMSWTTSVLVHLDPSQPESSSSDYRCF